MNSVVVGSLHISKLSSKSPRMCGRRMSRSVRSTTPSSRIGLRHVQHLPNWSYLYRRGMSHRMLAREVHRLLHAPAPEEFERAHLLPANGYRSTNRTNAV